MQNPAGISWIIGGRVGDWPRTYFGLGAPWRRLARPRRRCPSSAAASAAGSLATITSTEPPAFSTAASAPFDAPATLNVSLGGQLALAEQAHAVLAAARDARRLQRVLVDRPSWRRACRRRSASGPGRGSPRHSPWRTVLLKPRFGSRMWSGIWPPSKPLMATPERLFWPFWPRPPVLPLPEPMPRPTRMRLLAGAGIVTDVVEFHVVHSLSL